MENKKNDTANRELLMVRTLDAPIDLVWEVWTDPKHIANWWGPNGFTNTITTMDMRPGGKWNLVMHGPDGTDYENESIFREVVTNKKIVYEHISYPHIVATITFEELGDQTLLTWHMLFDSVEDFINVAKKYKAAEGLQQNGDKLMTYLAHHSSKNKV